MIELKKKLWNLIFILATTLIVLGISIPIGASAATYRIWGENRFDTAFAVADVLKGSNQQERFQNVVIASGRNYPDALSGSYLAEVMDAPILMAGNKNDEKLIGYVYENLAKDGTVYILGGSDAVSTELDQTLSGYQIIRLQGENRIETNMEILKATKVAGGEILVCTALDFADSLSASATGRPILLVNNRTRKLTEGQIELLSSWTDISFCIIGGENAVSSQLAKQLENFGTVRRIGGGNRLETSVMVAEAFFPEPECIMVGYGWNYPDALCGGVLINQLNGPVLLTMAGKETVAQEYIREKDVGAVFILGGVSLINDDSAGILCDTTNVYEAFCWLDGTEMGRSKPENVEAAKTFADKLYRENVEKDPVAGGFTWVGAEERRSWIYFTGLIHKGMLQLDQEQYLDLVRKFYTRHINQDGTIRNYAEGTLDAVLPAVNLITLLDTDVLTAEERNAYEKAVIYVYRQLENQTSYPQAGGLLMHAQDANGQPVAGWDRWSICLDGVYMSQIFLIRLAGLIDDGKITLTNGNGENVTSEEIWNAVYSRLVFVKENMTDPNTGLIYHGYCVDEMTTNGAFWSRGMGWYAMVLMEAAEAMPDEDRRAVLRSYFEDLMEALMDWQDPQSHLWFNVTNAREELVIRVQEKFIANQPETSGSSMFAYCLLRGYHNGLLEDARCRAAGLRAFNSMAERKLTENGLMDICLKSAVHTNPVMYQYFGYVENDGKAVGPFLLAAGYAY